MARDPSKRYRVDEPKRKHEAYGYGDDRAQTVAVRHEGRTPRVSLPPYAPPTTIVATASGGDSLYLIGLQQDEEDEDGDGAVIVRLWSASIARQAAALTSAGAGKSGIPCARFTAPWRAASIDTPRITLSVNRDAL